MRVNAPYEKFRMYEIGEQTTDVEGEIKKILAISATMEGSSIKLELLIDGTVFAQMLRLNKEIQV